MKKWKKEEGLKPKTDKFDIKGYRHTTINDAGRAALQTSYLPKTIEHLRIEYMSNRILKYEIPVATEFTLQLNQGSRIIKVAVINEKAYLWAIAPQKNAIIPVKFRVITTGEEFELPYTYQYIDTFILCYGEFVGHLFVDTSVPQHMKSFGL